MPIAETVIRRLLSHVAARCPQGKLPDSFFVLDSETTGVNTSTDRIIQLGTCVVENRKVVSSAAFLVSHADLVIPKEAEAVHGISTAKMRSQGIPAAEAFPMVKEMLSNYLDSGWLVLGHNICTFDVPIFRQELRRLGIEFDFPPNAVIDTGMLVKAAQLGMYLNSTDDLLTFFRRTSKIRSSVKWKLTGYCWDTFGLADSGIDKDKAHDAGVDCQLTAVLFEKLRRFLPDNTSSTAASMWS